MSTFKHGRWSNEEIKLVKEYVEQGLSYEQMEPKLNRPAETIRVQVEEKLLMNITKNALATRQAELDIKRSAEWPDIEQQLSETEKGLFLHHWRELISQFSNDVTHTERLQIMDVCRNEILISRVLKRINKANAAIEQYNNDYIIERSLPLELQDANKLVTIQGNISDETTAIGYLNKEYQELSKRKSETLKDIKGTREQRVRRIDESKETITGWIATLVAEPKIREELGKWMEKFRIAQKIEYERLSDYYVYANGEVEQPLLNTETLKEDNR